MDRPSGIEGERVTIRRNFRRLALPHILVLYLSYSLLMPCLVRPLTSRVASG